MKSATCVAQRVTHSASALIGFEFFFLAICSFFFFLVWKGFLRNQTSNWINILTIFHSILSYHIIHSFTILPLQSSWLRMGKSEVSFSPQDVLDCCSLTGCGGCEGGLPKVLNFLFLKQLTFCNLSQHSNTLRAMEWQKIILFIQRVYRIMQVGSKSCQRTKNIPNSHLEQCRGLSANHWTYFWSHVCVWHNLPTVQVDWYPFQHFLKYSITIAPISTFLNSLLHFRFWRPCHHDRGIWMRIKSTIFHREK